MEHWHFHGNPAPWPDVGFSSWFLSQPVAKWAPSGCKRGPWDHGPRAAGWVEPEGPAVWATLYGTASQGSGWAAIPLLGELSPQGAALPIGMEKPRGKQPHARNPIGPLESHHSYTASLPLAAWHVMLSASGAFPILFICPMAVAIPGWCPQVSLPSLPAVCCSSRTQGTGWQGLWDPHIGQQ